MEGGGSRVYYVLVGNRGRLRMREFDHGFEMLGACG